ncbi:MAG TPA: inositol monophosphatase, partial [Burkholderiaceae bacterium]|jgi:myo-inositol-1(or 4)-monophosphatase
LIGDFTGESQFLHQREVVAGNPKIYGQLVHLLAPFTQGRRGDAPAPAESTHSAAPAARKTLSRRPAKPAA